MTTAAMSKVSEPAGLPDMKVSVRQVFGIDSDLEVPAYSEVDPHVPDVDSDYRFDRATTLAILAGFAKNRRVMVTGYHGTGKSTHIEQVAARLNWPCVRVNLDSHISRIDLVGKDSIVVRDGKQVTEFRDGILPWALQHNIALVFDEYDAGRPDVMFVIQRVLEVSGRLTLLDQNKVIHPHPQSGLGTIERTRQSFHIDDIIHGHPVIHFKAVATATGSRGQGVQLVAIFQYDRLIGKRRLVRFETKCGHIHVPLDELCATNYFSPRKPVAAGRTKIDDQRWFLLADPFHQ